MSGDASHSYMNPNQEDSSNPRDINKLAVYND